MKKLFTFLAMLIATVSLSYAAVVPLDFESGTYDITNFDGGNLSIIDNPQSSGINTSAKVAQMIKNTGQTWGGAFISLDSPIDFSTNKTFKAKVFSPRIGAKVLLKVEHLSDNGIFFEKEVLTTKANEWEEMSFDYSLIDATKSYQKVILIFDNGTMGDGSVNFTFLIDDILLVDESSTTAPKPVLPVDFESTTIDYTFTNFDGGVVNIIDNPQSAGINTSAKVAQMVKNAGQPWGGGWIALAGPIDFGVGKTFKVKVYSPRIGAKLLFKVENISNGSIAFEKEVATTLANEWEELSFDFNTINTAESYQKIILIFDIGTMGDGSANFTFLLDDIQLVDESNGLEQIDLPVDFEGTTTDYTLTDFGGNSSVLGADPADASNTVAITTKTSNAETWAGTTIGTELGYKTIIPFTTSNTKISVDVYSPSAGLPVRLKIEDHKDNKLTAETEASTSKVNEWETLVFDFSNVAQGTNPFNLSTNFDKMSIFFNFDATGNGEVFYWDNVIFGTQTDVETMNIETISVFAHNGKLMVNGLENAKNGTISIYDLSGRVVLNTSISNPMESFKLNVKGVVMVRIFDAVHAPLKTVKVFIN